MATVTVVVMFDPGPATFVSRYPNMRSNAAAIQQSPEAAGDRYIDAFPFLNEVGPDRALPKAVGPANHVHALAGADRLAARAVVGAITGAVKSRAAAVIRNSRVGAFGA